MVIGILLDMREESALPLMQSAFERGAVDEAYVTLDDVMAGLRGERSPPRTTDEEDPLDYFRESNLAHLRGVHAKWYARRHGAMLEATDGRNPGPETGRHGRAQTRFLMRAGRNDACPCGSGKKYKKCCLPREMQAWVDQGRG